MQIDDDAAPHQASRPQLERTARLPRKCRLVDGFSRFRTDSEPDFRGDSGSFQETVVDSARTGPAKNGRLPGDNAQTVFKIIVTE